MKELSEKRPHEKLSTLIKRCHPCPEFTKDKLLFFLAFTLTGGHLKYNDHIGTFLNSLLDQFSYEELESIARKGCRCGHDQ